MYDEIRKPTSEEREIILKLVDTAAAYLSNLCEVDGKQYAFTVIFYIIAYQMKGYDDCLDFCNLLCKTHSRINSCAKQEI